jgi:hypothetical protein
LKHLQNFVGDAEHFCVGDQAALGRRHDVERALQRRRQEQLEIARLSILEAVYCHFFAQCIYFRETQTMPSGFSLHNTWVALLCLPEKNQYPGEIQTDDLLFLRQLQCQSSTQPLFYF